jgi:hypothetical protein
MRNNNDNSEKQQPPKELIELQAVAEPGPKQRGEAVEAQFIFRAVSLGFAVLKPWGDSSRYDAAIDHGHGFWRVQVKLTNRNHGSEYHLTLSGRGATYTKAEIDFVAAYVGPLDLWYILPVEIIASLAGVSLYPQIGSNSKYERYCEAWCLLDCPPHERGPKDIPTACRCPELAAHCPVCPLRK